MKQPSLCMLDGFACSVKCVYVWRVTVWREYCMDPVACDFDCYVSGQSQRRPTGAGNVLISLTVAL